MRYTSLSRQALHVEATISDHLEHKFFTGGQKVNGFVKVNPLVDAHGVARVVVDLGEVHGPAVRSSHLPVVRDDRSSNLSRHEVCVMNIVLIPTG